MVSERLVVLPLRRGVMARSLDPVELFRKEVSKLKKQVFLPGPSDALNVHSLIFMFDSFVSWVFWEKHWNGGRRG